MKLIDNILKESGTVFFPQKIEEFTLVDIQNVENYFRNIYGENGELSVKSFPNILPPWDKFYMEYIHWSKEYKVYYALGCLFTAEYIDDATKGKLLLIPEIKTKEQTDRIMNSFVILKFKVFGGNVKNKSIADSMGLFTGHIIIGKNGDLINWAIDEESGATYDYSRRDGVTHHQVLFNSLYSPLLAISFTNCKNVKLQDHPVPPKVAKKRIANGKPPGVTYKTLVIDPMKEVLKTEGKIETNGLKKALHICRGHFATYTENKPLFGRVTGTFWKPMHVKGNKNHGEVKKDYRILAGSG